MKKNRHMGKCEEYLAEVHKGVGNNSNGIGGFVLPEFALNAYMSSIALSLAVIADKMCEEEVGNEQIL